MKDILVSNILRNMRTINTNLTQKELAKKMNLAPNTISSYEIGYSQPDFERIIKYAEICDFEIKIYNKKTNEEISLRDLSKER